MMLEEERRFFNENLATWLAEYPGKVVLVKGQRLVGVFDSVDAALAEGARQFGLESFLVRPVQAERAEVKLPALTLGLLRADSTHPA